MDRRETIALILATVLGVLIAYVDSRPTWDDTGLTAAAILATAALLGAISPRRPWAVALAVGAWTPLVGILSAANDGSLLALAFAFAGAFVGMAARRGLVAAVK